MGRHDSMAEQSPSWRLGPWGAGGGAFFGASCADIKRSIDMDLKKTWWLKALLLAFVFGGVGTLAACDYDDEAEIEIDDDNGEIEIDTDD
jgi:4-hydroxybenzoate polyprenyltransferase